MPKDQYSDSAGSQLCGFLSIIITATNRICNFKSPHSDASLVTSMNLDNHIHRMPLLLKTEARGFSQRLSGCWSQGRNICTQVGQVDHNLGIGIDHSGRNTSNASSDRTVTRADSSVPFLALDLDCPANQLDAWDICRTW